MEFTIHSLIRLYERDNYDEKITKEDILKDIKNSWPTLVIIGDFYKVRGEYFDYILSDNKLITLLLKRKSMSEYEYKKYKKQWKRRGIKTITLNKKDKHKIKSKFNFKIFE